MNTWLAAFLVSCGNGKRIGDATTKETAIYEAIAKVNLKHSGVLGGLDKIYSAGSTTQKLVS